MVLDAVFKAITTTHPSLPSKQQFRLPKRLFHSLSPSKGARGTDTGIHAFVKYLFQLRPGPDPNSHDGYALVRAVQARNVPIIRLLLAHGADPERRDNLAVMLAIQSKELSLVKLLVERDDKLRSSGPGKRRNLEDRVAVTAAMLRVAVKKQATDIAEWLMREKGCVPDMRTLMSLR
jgi:ankyrin repeat protein